MGIISLNNGDVVSFTAKKTGKKIKNYWGEEFDEWENIPALVKGFELKKEHTYLMVYNNNDMYKKAMNSS